MMNKNVMKVTGIIFLLLSAVCIILLAFTGIGNVPRGSIQPWTFTGPIIFGSFFLGAGAALLLSVRKMNHLNSDH